MFDKTRLLETLTDLLKINAPSGAEAPVRAYLERFFEKIGFKPEIDSAGNMYIALPGKASKEPVAFLAHMDTIKPTEGVRIRLTDTHIFGDGDGSHILGADDRAGIALICELTRFLAETESDNNRYRPLEIIFTVKEEIGLLGIKSFDCAKIKSKVAFTLDVVGPTGYIVTRSPSREEIKVVVKGRSSHAGAEPEKGVNAIAIAARAINGIRQGKVSEDTSLNIGKISSGGGTALNIVADKVVAKAEIRSFTQDELDRCAADLEDKFRGASREFGGEIEVSRKKDYPGFCLRAGSIPEKIAVSAAKRAGLDFKIGRSGGGSDANILNERGIESVGLGVGMFDAHTASENIALADFYKSLDWIFEIAVGED